MCVFPSLAKFLVNHEIRRYPMTWGAKDGQRWPAKCSEMKWKLNWMERKLPTVEGH